MDNPIICQVDKKECASVEELHNHLRSFRIKQSDYYETYHAKRDLLTGELIPFKNYDQYLSARFLNKINARKFFKTNPEEGKKLAIEMLKERIDIKGLRKLPGEVELVSCGLPNSQFYYETLGELTKSEIGTPIYQYGRGQLAFSKKISEIIIDSREQDALILKGVKTIQQGLKFADYAIVGEENKVVIERKSLADFVSSFVRGYERIHKEFQRAKDAGAYLIVLCEESLTTALSYPHIPYFRRYTKMPPEVVFHNVRNLIQEFDCQFVFCDGRVKSAETLLKIFQLGEQVKTMDLQYLIDRAKTL